MENANPDQEEQVILDTEDLINALAYADDIVLLSTTKEGLQKGIDTVQDYCNDWGLMINDSKTKTMIFSKGNQKIKTTFTLNGVELENTKDYKYLGITIHKKNCSFNPALTYLRNKAIRAIYALRSKVDVNRLPIPTALKLFDSLIKPILLYSSEVWETFIENEPDKWDNNDIEKVYKRFLKQILGVNSSASTPMVRGELNRHSLQEEILRRNINYAKYIYEKEDIMIVKQAYTHELSRSIESKTFFSTMQKHTAKINTMASTTLHPYADPFVNIYELEPKTLRMVTNELFHDEWKLKLESSTKADTYRLIKDNMGFEPYLMHVNRKERVAMTKLRISDHKLMIEVERHKRPVPPREERTCYMCNTKVEDEIHFMTDCKLYGAKDIFWQRIYTDFPQITNLSNEEKFIFIMTQEDPDTMMTLMKTNREWQTLRTFMCDNFYEQKE